MQAVFHSRVGFAVDLDALLAVFACKQCVLGFSDACREAILFRMQRVRLVLSVDKTAVEQCLRWHSGTWPALASASLCYDGAFFLQTKERSRRACLVFPL
jgi:hypothetical protein